MKIGLLIRTLRTARGYRQYQFAARLGLRPPVLSRLELGRQPWPPDLLARALVELGLPPNALTSRSSGRAEEAIR